MIWWLSFADPSAPKGEQFIGACVVEADEFVAAVRCAHALGCNPGGEVAGLCADIAPHDSSCLGKLYRGKAGAEELSSLLHGPDDRGIRSLRSLADDGGRS